MNTFVKLFALISLAIAASRQTYAQTLPPMSVGTRVKLFADTAHFTADWIGLRGVRHHPQKIAIGTAVITGVAAGLILPGVVECGSRPCTGRRVKAAVIGFGGGFGFGLVGGITLGYIVSGRWDVVYRR